VDKQRLSALLAYARDTGACRRNALLRLLDYDGEGENPPTACCDVCDGNARNTLREERLLAFFKQNRRRYTSDEAAHLLATFPQYAWTENDAQKVIQGLIAMNKLSVIKNCLWKHKLTCAR
jgi:ATP-dependent DNA helicase RecQ